MINNSSTPEEAFPATPEQVEAFLTDVEQAERPAYEPGEAVRVVGRGGEYGVIARWQNEGSAEWVYSLTDGVRSPFLRAESALEKGTGVGG